MSGAGNRRDEIGGRADYDRLVVKGIANEGKINSMRETGQNQPAQDTQDQCANGLYRLLAGALEIWQLDARLVAKGAGCEVALENRVMLSVAPVGEAGARARWRIELWRVARPGPPRITTHAGTPGMLRAVRAALDPSHRPARMTVAPEPVLD